MKTCPIDGEAVPRWRRIYCSEQCAKRGKLIRNRAWNAAHPEIMAKNGRRYYETNQDKVNAQSRLRRAANLEEYNENLRRARRAKTLAFRILNDITPEGAIDWHTLTQD
jgi:hypothetical protein